MTSIAVIGAGFSGTMTTVQLLKKFNAARKHAKIFLVDTVGTYGYGVAYRTPRSDHLLNVPAGGMSAWPNEPRHFLDWIRRRRGPTEATDFVARKWYGQYVHEILLEEMNRQKTFVSVELIADTAVDCEPLSSRYKVHLQSGRSLTADFVVLALGHQKPAAIRAFKNIERHPRYIGDPWQYTSSEAIHGQVLILGTGLTMIDTVLSLVGLGLEGKITALSRHGFVPAAHALKTPRASDGPLATHSLREIVSEVRSRINGKGGNTWQAEIDALRPFLQKIWRGLSASDQRRFLHHVRPYWDIVRHRTAPEISARIKKMIESQHLEILAGRVLSVTVQDSSFRVRIRSRQNGLIEERTFDWIFNCTGPETDLQRVRQPLIRNLLAKGLITTDPLRLGLRADANGTVIGTDGHATKGIYAIGPLLKGELWESIAVPELRVQAEAVATRIVGSTRE